MNYKIIFTFLGLLIITSVHSQNIFQYLLTPENIEFTSKPNPVNGIMPANDLSKFSKPILLETFNKSAKCSAVASNLYQGAGSVSNVFFGGDDGTNNFGWGCSSLFLTKKFSKVDFPILIETRFFSRQAVANYNEFYIWIGRYLRESYNGPMSQTPNIDIQEGLAIGGTPDKTLIINLNSSTEGRTYYVDDTHNKNKYGQWLNVSVILDIDKTDNKLIIKDYSINGKCMVNFSSGNLKIDNCPWINEFALALLPDDIAEGFKVTTNYNPGSINLSKDTLCINEKTNIIGSLGIENYCNIISSTNFLWRVENEIISNNENYINDISFNEAGQKHIEFIVNGEIVDEKIINVKKCQEICDNNSDDNFDGLIDCDDPEIMNECCCLEQQATQIITQFICEGDSVRLNGEWFKNEGIYYQNFHSVNECDSIIKIIIEKFTPNNDTIEFNSKSFCPGDTIKLFLQNTEANNVQWKINDQFITNAKNCSITPSENSTITAHYIDKNGCTVVKSLEIAKKDILDSNFEYAVDYCANEIKIFPAIKGGLVEVYFNDAPNNNISDYTIPFTYGFYNITYIQNKNTNCESKHQEFFEINEIKNQPYTDFVPNIFCPTCLNNNVICFNTDNIVIIAIEIYDRWGNLLFIGDNDNSCWDGSFNNKLCESDVYVAQIKYHYESNCEKLNQRLIKNITLIR